MSEYIINGTLLTNIADAVRSVDGSTSTLTPQQMETRLKAIKSSIDSALSALTAKEVEVPSDSTIHRLAELITSIEAGGGDQTIDGRPFAWGILAPAENITSQITLLTYRDAPWLDVGTSASRRARTVSSFITRFPSTSRPNFSTLAIGASGPVYWNGGTNNIGGSVYYFNSSGRSYATDASTLIELSNGTLFLNPSNTYPLVAGESYFWLSMQIIMPEDFT